MIYKEFVDSVKNPLEKKDIIDKLIRIYANEYNFYSKLVHTNIDNKVTRQYIPAVRDDLEVEVFNTWRERLLEESNNINSSLLKKFARYINKFNPKTEEEVRQIRISLHKSEFKEIFDKCDYKRHDFGSGWIHKNSNLIQLDNSYNQQVEHRLYINCDSYLVDSIAKKLIDKCNAKSIGYIFKYDIDATRADTMVIYSDSKHLPIYLNILREIKNEIEVEYEDRKEGKLFYEPPLLTGTIDNWLGYGSEPSKEDTLNEDDRSYNMKRVLHIEECLDNRFSRWLLTNKNLQVNINGKIMPYKEFFAKELANQYRKKMLDSYGEETEKKQKSNGYTKKDIESTEFLRVVTDFIMKNYDQIVNLLLNKRDINTSKISFKNGNLYLFSGVLIDMIKKHSEIIVDSFPNLKNIILNDIKETSDKWNISSNYAFDKYAVLSLYKEEKHKSTEEIVDQKRFPNVNTKVYKYTHKAMTNEEIKEARRKLGFE